MRIDEIEDDAVRKTQARFASVLESIQYGERRIMSAADEILAMGEAISSGKYIDNGNDFTTEIPQNTYGGAIEPRATVKDWLEERYIGRNDTVSIEFLELGIYAKRPVGRISSDYGPGTGFLVGHDLMMTAAHIVRDPKIAGAMEFELNVEENLYGGMLQPRSYGLDSNKFFWHHPQSDVVIIGLTDWAVSQPPLSSFGWHVLKPVRKLVEAADPVNIIQHPEGKAKRLAAHNSRFMTVSQDQDGAKHCWYTGDTFGGSSGSPVFNLNWEVVALHQRAVARTDREGRLLRLNGEFAADMNDSKLAYIANQGLLTTVVYGLLKNTPCPEPRHERMRHNLLEMWEHPGADARALKARIGSPQGGMV